MSSDGTKKNVLMVVRWPVGGIRTFLRYVFRGFDIDAWSFMVIAPDLPEMNVLLEEDLGHLDMSFRPVGAQASARELAAAILSALVRGRIDLVHSHGFTSGLCAAPSARWLRVPHLVTSHDVITDAQFPGYLGRLKLALVGETLNLADRIHSVSGDAQRNLLHYLPAIDPSKCVVINNGIEVNRFLNDTTRDLRSELELDEDVFLIGFMGRFMKQKGFRDLVEAIGILARRKDLPRRPLVLTFGEGGFKRQDSEYVRERGLESSFHFLPFTANVAGSLHGLDLLAMPSRWEACGLLAMEALVCGTPLVASNCIGLREVIANTPAGIFDAGDPTALAEALLAEMRTDRRSEFAAYRSTAAGRYNVAHQARGIEQLYCQLGSAR